MENFGGNVQENPEQLNKVLRFINESRGVDLYSYRPRFVLRHLRFRMVEVKCSDYADYIKYLKDKPEETDCFLRDLSINVTHFFRDPEVFVAFQKGPLAELIERKNKNSLKSIRCWSAGCASGQEAYSLAIMLREALGTASVFKINVWATDVDSQSLERAQIGEYEEKDLKEVGKKMLEKYFRPAYNGKYSVRDEIREMVRFKKQNLISDLSLNFMDIIFCRNVMIYFTSQQHEVLFRKFHQTLNPKGYLVVSKVENISGRELFSSIDNYNKIYQKIN